MVHINFIWTKLNQGGGTCSQRGKILDPPALPLSKQMPFLVRFFWVTFLFFSQLLFTLSALFLFWHFFFFITFSFFGTFSCFPYLFSLVSVLYHLLCVFTKKAKILHHEWQLPFISSSVFVTFQSPCVTFQSLFIHHVTGLAKGLQLC